jgi:hypothetical protein
MKIAFCLATSISALWQNYHYTDLLQILLRCRLHTHNCGIGSAYLFMFLVGSCVGIEKFLGAIAPWGSIRSVRLLHLCCLIVLPVLSMCPFLSCNTTVFLILTLKWVNSNYASKILITWFYFNDISGLLLGTLWIICGLIVLLGWLS